MIATTRAFLTAKIAVCVALLACASLLPAAVAAGAAITVAYQNETFKQYEQQLAGAQIQSVTINKRLRSLRITLKDGRYVLAKYKAHEEPTVAAALEAKHVPVTALAPSEALKEVAKKPVHHKLRYIAGGILIVVIVIVGAVLYINRRRNADRD
jgi:hypothetical protein